MMRQMEAPKFAANSAFRPIKPSKPIAKTKRELQLLGGLQVQKQGSAEEQQLTH